MNLQPESAAASGITATEVLDVSVIVGTRNRPDFVLTLVESIFAGEVLPAEVIIIDQSDEPHPVLPSRSGPPGCEIWYHHSVSVGVSRARNQGLRLARYPIVVLTDDDMVVPPEWLRSMVLGLHDAGPNSVICGQVLDVKDGAHPGFAASLRSDRERVVYSRPGLRADVLYTGNMGLWRSLAEAVGEFDERLGPGTAFPAAEDGDYGLRILRGGYRIVYEPRVVSYHRAWRSEPDLLRLYVGYGIGQGAFYMKHILQANPVACFRLANDVVRSLLSQPYWWLRSPRRAREKLYFAHGVVRGAVRWARRHALRSDDTPSG
jgi:GT2 family glycosyltransferase